MPKRRGTRHRPNALTASASTRRRRSEANGQAALKRATTAILRSIDGIATWPDPLLAEIEASRVISILEIDPSALPDERLHLVERLLTELRGRRTPDVLALTLGLRALLSDPWRSRADLVIRELIARGVAQPSWADDVGGAVFEAAWAWTDEFGDQDLVVAAFRYPGRDPHAIRLMADHNFNGLIRQAAVDPDPALVRQVWFETSGVPLRPITGRDLATRWAAGTTWYRRYLDAPVYEDVPPLMALLEARAAVLPTPSEPVETEPMSDDERRALVDRFLAAPAADETGLDRAQDGRTAVLVDHLLDFRENHGEGDVLRWGPIVVEICLVDWMPRKAILDTDEIKAMPAVLRAFVRFAADQKGLAAADLAATLNAVDEFETLFREAMADDHQAGPGKALAQQMIAEGVDLDDPVSLQRWIDDFNRRPIEERDDVLGPPHLPSSRKTP